MPPVSDAPQRHGAAFFDVDETLVSVRTLESFLLYYLRRVPSMIRPDRLRQLRQEVLDLDRVAFNRVYFGLWAGQPAEQVFAAGREWYREASRAPGFFRANVLERLTRHRDDGDDVVLVSGSFGPALRPLADDVGADALHCTELETDAAGTFTGRITAAMLGPDKRRTVETHLARGDVDPAHSWGYGDHPSDLPLLERVAVPVVVGTDPGLGAVARDRGWTILPIDAPLAPRSSPPR